MITLELEKVLDQFDAAEANLRRLEKVWSEMQSLIPSPGSFSFVISGPDADRYDELQRAYLSIAKGLPAIDTFAFTAVPWDLNSIAMNRFDAMEIDELSAKISVEEGIEEPSRQINEYRFRLSQARRALVRDHLIEAMSHVDDLLVAMRHRIARDQAAIGDPDWEELVEILNQIERLAGNQIPRTARWKEMRRHISWRQGKDLHDIADHDWPSVRAEIQTNLYSELEPLPVEVENLQSLVTSKPSGKVTTKLNWQAISDEQFERLLFNMLTDAADYNNVQWLTHTNAPDRGRDLSAEKIIPDTLGSTKNQRVIVQAKHWLSRSVRAQDISDTVTQVSLWEPPIVHVLILATSGRFTSDAVAWVEKNNNNGVRPFVEMWPDSHLELLLAQRPHLVAEFNLR